MSKQSENDQYVKDWREWQDNQYSPGYYVGGDKLPLPLKQLGKKPWFRGITIIYLLLLMAGLVYAFWQMLAYIFQK